MDVVAAEHRLVRFRLLGWSLVGLSQLAALVNVALRYATPTLDMLGRAVGIVGLVIVAWGFERFVELHHHALTGHERSRGALLRPGPHARGGGGFPRPRNCDPTPGRRIREPGIPPSAS